MSVQEHFNPQSTDIFVASCPNTGTTWLKALTFAILTRSRLSGSTTGSLLTKMPHDCVPFLEYDLAPDPSNRDLAIPLVSTHVPYSCLPQSIISSSCKIIYICRDAKDVFVSLWYFNAKLHRLENVDPLPLEEAFELFCNGIANYGPYWDHVLGQGGARKNVTKIDDGDHISIFRDITWSTFIIIIIGAILKQLKILKF
uniref:Sulfotransferase n=1 Tax=Populus alba TaxID=43335 RepID=A0A4U5PPD8_POPAL|nr:flavonol 3-sulfotransferase-like [Populus alba]